MANKKKYVSTSLNEYNRKYSSKNTDRQTIKKKIINKIVNYEFDKELASLIEELGKYNIKYPAQELEKELQEKYNISVDIAEKYQMPGKLSEKHVEALDRYFIFNQYTPTKIIFKQLLSLNPSLRIFEKYLSKQFFRASGGVIQDIIRGVTSRFNTNDIQFFIKSPSGDIRSRNKEYLGLRDDLRKLGINPSYVPSPNTVHKIIYEIKNKT